MWMVDDVNMSVFHQFDTGWDKFVFYMMFRLPPWEGVGVYAPFSVNRFSLMSGLIGLNVEK